MGQCIIKKNVQIKDVQIEDVQKDIALIFAEYAEKLSIKYKDEVEEKICSVILEFAAMIAIGKYIIKYDNLPQDCNILSININIYRFYIILYTIKHVCELEHNKMYDDISEIIEYLDSIVHIIKPICDAFEHKKCKYFIQLVLSTTH